MSLKSFFKKVEKTLRPVLSPILKTAIGATPGGQALLMGRQALISTKKAAQGVVPRNSVLPGAGAMGAQLGMNASILRPDFARTTMATTGSVRSPTQLAMRGVNQMSLKSALPTLGRIGGAIGRSLPGIGTAIAVGSVLYDAAGNPVARAPGRRRRKGITATELKAFTRVTAVLNKYCKTPSPTKRRSAPRGKSCR